MILDFTFKIFSVLLSVIMFFVLTVSLVFSNAYKLVLFPLNKIKNVSIPNTSMERSTVNNTVTG